MRLAERHRLNPRKKEKTKDESPQRDPSVRLRRGGRAQDKGVVYLSKGVYNAPSPAKESPEDLLKRLNSSFGLRLELDADKLLLEIFRRGWKVSGFDLDTNRTYKVRFHRAVGDEKSRTFSKKADSVKKLLLMTLEHVLNHEDDRYKRRMAKIRKSDKP